MKNQSALQSAKSVSQSLKDQPVLHVAKLSEAKGAESLKSLMEDLKKSPPKSERFLTLNPCSLKYFHSL